MKNTIRILPSRKLSAEVWRLAGPVVIGMISQTLLNVVDTAMVGRLGAASLGAAGLGGMLAWLVLGSFGALNVGTQTVASRRFGEGDPYSAGKVLDNSIILGVMLGLTITLIVAPVMRELFRFFSADPEVVREGSGYIYYRLLGGLPLMLIMAFRGFFNGIGKTRLHMSVAIIVNCSNVLLNYMFIFGNFGMPRMETHGAGLASALATAIGAITFLAIALRPYWRNEFQIFRITNLNRNVSFSVLRLAFPTGLRALAEMFAFSAFTLIVARLGTVELAATNVCITVMSLSFLPGAGVGVAAATLIGQKLGEGKPKEAEIFGWEAGRNGMLLMGLVGVIFFIFPEQIFRIFTDDAEVIKAGIIPLRFMGLVQSFDAAGMVFMLALEGAGMNRWVFIAAGIISWGFFIPGTIIAAYVFKLGMIGAWAVLGVYLVIFGIAMTLKFAGGGWKTVKV
ncbi:MATE family efflux transporter [Calditrichota bacterium]